MGIIRRPFIFTFVIYSFSRRFYPKRLTLRNTIGDTFIKRQTDTGSACNTISRQCSEQILARQREFKGKRAKLRKGILKMKSSDDGREMSFSDVA